MDYTKIIKEIGRGKNHACDLDRETAFQLYQKMLAGEVGELELGGAALANGIPGENADQKGLKANVHEDKSSSIVTGVAKAPGG